MLFLVERCARLVCKQQKWRSLLPWRVTQSPMHPLSQLSEWYKWTHIIWSSDFTRFLMQGPVLEPEGRHMIPLGTPVLEEKLHKPKLHLNSCFSKVCTKVGTTLGENHCNIFWGMTLSSCEIQLEWSHKCCWGITFSSAEHCTFVKNFALWCYQVSKQFAICMTKAVKMLVEVDKYAGLNNALRWRIIDMPNYRLVF